LISDHINDVEALGDIGTINLEAVAKALSKNRSLYVPSVPFQDSRHLLYQDIRKRASFLQPSKYHTDVV